VHGEPKARWGAVQCFCVHVSRQQDVQANPCGHVMQPDPASIVIKLVVGQLVSGLQLMSSRRQVGGHRRYRTQNWPRTYTAALPSSWLSTHGAARGVVQGRSCVPGRPPSPRDRARSGSAGSQQVFGVLHRPRHGPAAHRCRGHGSWGSRDVPTRDGPPRAGAPAPSFRARRHDLRRRRTGSADANQAAQHPGYPRAAANTASSGRSTQSVPCCGAGRPTSITGQGDRRISASAIGPMRMLQDCSLW
jgi:hypothetical protein